MCMSLRWLLLRSFANFEDRPMMLCIFGKQLYICKRCELIRDIYVCHQQIKKITAQYTPFFLCFVSWSTVIVLCKSHNNLRELVEIYFYEKLKIGV
jgi:hypothetical protein